jgi:hypothetical protein
MRKSVAKIKALINGEASIEYIDKTLISKTPGEVTDVGHN